MKYYINKTINTDFETAIVRVTGNSYRKSYRSPQKRRFWRNFGY